MEGSINAQAHSSHQPKLLQGLALLVMYSSIKDTGCFDSRLFFSKISSQLPLVYIGPISGSCLFLRG